MKISSNKKAVSVSANAAVNAANMVDVVQGNKKRPHDAIDQDYLTMVYHKHTHSICFMFFLLVGFL